MPKLLNKIMGYIACLLLGLYISRQFIYHGYIEPSRWVITILITVMFIVMGELKDE